MTALFSKTLNQLAAVRNAALAAQETGAHLTRPPEESTYFPEVDPDALLCAVEVENADDRTKEAIVIVLKAHWWTRIDDYAITRVLRAAKHLLWTLHEQVRKAERSQRDHAELVRWCTFLENDCNRLRKELGQASEGFSTAAFQAMATDALRAEHKRLCDAQTELKSQVRAEQRSAPREERKPRSGDRRRNSPRQAQSSTEKPQAKSKFDEDLERIRANAKARKAKAEELAAAAKAKESAA